MTNEKRNRLSAWGLCLFAIVRITAVGTTTLIDNQRQGILDAAHLVEVAGAVIVLTTFAILGALIISHQPYNRVGWLLMIPVLDRVIPLEMLGASLPETLTIGWWLLLWWGEWGWMLFIFPVLLLPLHFPTGRPPTPRWNWVNWLALGMWALLAVLYAFANNFADYGNGMVSNPIGFLPPDLPERIGRSTLWNVSLLLIAVGSVVSLLVRYGRAQTAERQQIKWLAYTGIFFAVVFGLEVSSALEGQSADQEAWLTILFYLSILTFAAAIGIAILRHQLFDIDVIIRKTLVYAVLSGLLALAYLGMVVMLQNLFDLVSGEQSPVINVISTLSIAALFAPLRQRVQVFIDRRFFRQKYDAQQILAQFAQTARDEVEMDALTAELSRVVQEAMQPERVSVWVQEVKL